MIPEKLSSASEVDDIDIKPLKQEEQAPEVSAEATDLVRTKFGSELGIFYTTVKKKFSDPEAGWSAMKLEAQSPQILGPIILELRNALRAGGAAEPDRLIGSLITKAQELSASGRSKHDFLEQVTNLGKMTPGSGVEKFYSFATKGLETAQAK